MGKRKDQSKALLWINKNVQSEMLSKSDDAETHRILSHVRNGQHPRKDGDQPWMAYASCIEMNQGERENIETLPKESRKNAGKIVPPQKALARHHPSQTTYRAAAIHREARPPVLSVRFPCYNSSDPFHSTVLGLDATRSMNVIANSVSSRISRITFLAEALAPPHLVAQQPHHRHDKFRKERLRACVDSELLMCSSIAHGSSSLAWVDGTIRDGKSQYFVTKTLRAVRSRLSQPHIELHKSLVLSIYTLAVTELWNAIPDMWQQNPRTVHRIHLQACKTHLSALCILVQQAGGWSTVSPYILEGMILADKYVAIYSEVPPIVPLTWEPGPFPQEPSILHAWSTSPLPSPYPGSGFDGYGIESNLLSAVQDMALFMHTAANVWNSSIVISGDFESWLYLRLNTFIYHILLHEHHTQLESVVRLASLISQFHLVTYAGAALSAQFLLGRLRKALERCSTSVIGKDSDLRIWCLCTGALVKGSSPQKSWFIEQLVRLIDDFAMPVDIDQLSQKLQTYIYVPVRQDQDLSALLTTLHSERLGKHLPLDWNIDDPLTTSLVVLGDQNGHVFACKAQRHNSTSAFSEACLC